MTLGYSMRGLRVKSYVVQAVTSGGRSGVFVAVWVVSKNY